jgi:hypothetical protein
MSSDRNLGPPGGRDGEGRATPSPATVEEPPPSSSPTPHPHDKRAHRQGRPETGMWRRRQAAQRLAPLGRCGCIRDPLHDHHRCGDEITENMATGYKAAVLHLRSLGVLPAPLIPEMQALWRRGGADRQLAQELFELVAGGEA